MIAFAACFPALGCTDSTLYGAGSEPNYANRISLEGDICTDDPSAVKFPVKILVVMDGTASLVGADPTQPAQAALQLTQRYPNNNYQYGFMTYGQLSTLITPGGFTNDVTATQTGLATLALGNADAQRSYLEPIRAAARVIEDDILGSTPGVRSRTRYVVLFVAYGPPSPPLQDLWCQGHGLTPMTAQCTMDFDMAFCPTTMPQPADCEALLYPSIVGDLRDFALKNGAEDLVFDTFALTNDMRTTQLLSAIASSGHGTATAQTLGALNFLGVDIASPSSLLVLRELTVYNRNAVIWNNTPSPDSDGDGLADDEEKQLGTDPTLADTDGDLLTDKVERILQLDPLKADMPSQCMNIMPPDVDTDQDGLIDCEEALLRTDPTLADTDRDGIPDLVEVLRGGNPLVNDLLTDSNQDGVLDGEAMKQGLEVNQYDPDMQLNYGYQYDVFDEGAKMRMEADPPDPFAGVLITQVTGSDAAVRLLCYDAGPPPTLAWSDDVTTCPAPCTMPNERPDCPVDVAGGGTFTLTSSSGNTITVEVNPGDLASNSGPFPLKYQILTRQTLRSCFHFMVRDITLVQTLNVVGGRPGLGWNTLATYMAEVPMSTPLGNSIVDEATAPVRFIAPNKKTPNKPFINLTQDSFVVLGGG